MHEDTSLKVTEESLGESHWNENHTQIKWTQDQTQKDHEGRSNHTGNLYQEGQILESKGFLGFIIHPRFEAHLWEYTKPLPQYHKTRVKICFRDRGWVAKEEANKEGRAVSAACSGSYVSEAFGNYCNDKINEGNNVHHKRCSIYIFHINPLQYFVYTLHDFIDRTGRK